LKQLPGYPDGFDFYKQVIQVGIDRKNFDCYLLFMLEINNKCFFKEKTVQIQLKEFTGPLDVLLQLIRREEMSILDIDVHKITDQYLEFIESQPIPDLHFAGDFIRMAALLIYIKSKSVLPEFAWCNDLQREDREEQELKADLTISLLKMQIVQSISRKFNQYALLGRDTWSSYAGMQPMKWNCFEQEKNEVKKNPLLSLLKAYHCVENRVSGKKPTEVNLEEHTPVLTDRISSIQSRLRAGNHFNMSSLLSYSNKPGYILTTFLSLLELSRLGIVTLFQKEYFSDIEVCVKKSFNEEDIGSVRNEYVDSLPETETAL